METIHIFDSTLRTTEIEGTRYAVLNDILRVADVGWRDFCMARTSMDAFIDYELKPLFIDLGIVEVDGLVLMPIEYTEILILRSSTGYRPLTPFSRISECARSIVDFWMLKDSGDNRNVFVIENNEDQTYRSVIPELR